MFGDLIKKYIEDKNITVAIFASMIRVNRQTVYNWIAGKNQIKRPSAIKIEEMTRKEISFEQMMGYKRVEKPKPVRRS